MCSARLPLWWAGNLVPFGGDGGAGGIGKGERIRGRTGPPEAVCRGEQEHFDLPELEKRCWQGERLPFVGLGCWQSSGVGRGLREVRGGGE